MTLLIAIILLSQMDAPAELYIVVFMVWLTHLMFYGWVDTKKSRIEIPTCRTPQHSGYQHEVSDDKNWEPVIAERRGNLLRYGQIVIEIRDGVE